jgi:hypothetical protein
MAGHHCGTPAWLQISEFNLVEGQIEVNLKVQAQVVLTTQLLLGARFASPVG